MIKSLILTLSLTTACLASQTPDIDDTYADNIRKIERRVMHYQYIKEKDFMEITIPMIERRCRELGKMGETALPQRKRIALEDLYNDITTYQQYLVTNTTPEGLPPLCVAPVHRTYSLFINGVIISRNPYPSSPSLSNGSPIDIFSPRQDVSDASTPINRAGASPQIRAVQSKSSIADSSDNWI